MTQTSNRLFDEFARLMTDATGVAQGLKREVDTLVKSQLERLLADMDLVRREEVDVVRDMAAKARAENDKLAARIDELEARLGAADKPKPAKAARTPAKKSVKAKSSEA